MNLIYVTNWPDIANWAVDNLVAPMVVGLLLIFFEHYFFANKKTSKKFFKNALTKGVFFDKIRFLFQP